MLKFPYRSNALSTQEQALDRIIDLSIADDDFRDLLKESVSRTTASCDENSSIWWTLNISLQEKTQKVITVLSDSRIRHAIESAVFYNENYSKFTSLDAIRDLTVYLLYVSSADRLVSLFICYLQRPRLFLPDYSLFTQSYSS